MEQLNLDLDSYLIPYKSSVFPSGKLYDVPGYESSKLFDFVDKRIVASGIFDLRVKDSQNASAAYTSWASIAAAHIKLTLLRIEDAKKSGTRVDSDFSTAPDNKYLEEFEWTTYTKNKR